MVVVVAGTSGLEYAGCCLVGYVGMSTAGCRIWMDGYVPDGGYVGRRNTVGCRFAVKFNQINNNSNTNK